ncbi:IpaD/SipD/SspD family type III secretion system needle tip protein [Undibacterium sp. CCC3.4]|nr:IpaD/SipD/SspD family type III secretion system needle tip protein [Undibacterium sp. CCC3.4]WPX43474.1 IpaD/SipD/SspD family type III secretion system needle tip protein [Undibacterium sp. CCC3.4]
MFTVTPRLSNNILFSDAASATLKTSEPSVNLVAVPKSNTAVLNYAAQASRALDTLYGAKSAATGTAANVLAQTQLAQSMAALDALAVPVPATVSDAVAMALSASTGTAQTSGRSIFTDPLVPADPLTPAMETIYQAYLVFAGKLQASGPVVGEPVADYRARLEALKNEYHGLALTERMIYSDEFEQFLILNEAMGLPPNTLTIVSLMASPAPGAPEMLLPFASIDTSMIDQMLKKIEGQSGTIIFQHSDTSSIQLWQETAEAMSSINNNYLNIYQDSLGKYNDFNAEFSDIVSNMTSMVERGIKEGEITFRVGILYTQLAALKAKYSFDTNDPQGAASQAAHIFTGSEAEAKAWAKRLGMPESTVVAITSPGSVGLYSVVLDTAPISSLLNSLSGLVFGSGSTSPVDSTMRRELTSANFSQWQTSFDTQSERVKQGLSAMSQKYSSAQSSFDNMIQVLSKTIPALADTDKTFFQI